MERPIRDITGSDSFNYFVNLSHDPWKLGIIEAILFYNPLIDSSISENNELLFKIISSIDLFIIAIVLLILALVFMNYLSVKLILQIQKFKESTLIIRDLDQLKNKIIKVIIIVLIVKFLKKYLSIREFSSTTDILYFGLSILSICMGLYTYSTESKCLYSKASEYLPPAPVCLCLVLGFVDLPQESLQNWQSSRYFQSPLAISQTTNRPWCLRQTNQT